MTNVRGRECRVVDGTTGSLRLKSERNAGKPGRIRSFGGLGGATRMETALIAVSEEREQEKSVRPLYALFAIATAGLLVYSQT